MKRLRIVWGTFLTVLVILLTIFGFVYTSKRTPYKDAETKLVESAKKYVDVKFLYPSEKESTRVSYSEMKEEGYIDKLSVNDDACDGYVIVSSNGMTFEYKG